MSHLDDALSTPGKYKTHHRWQWHHSPYPKLAIYSFIFGAGTILLFTQFLLSPPSSALNSHNSGTSSSLRHSLRTSSWGGLDWEKKVRNSARMPCADGGGFSVLITGAAGFVGTNVSSVLKRRGDGVLGLDVFNDYYNRSLKRAHQALLERSGVFIGEGDINDGDLLRKLFDVIPFTHVMHLAAQAEVRYAMKNPSSYVHSNIVGFVSLLEAAKSVDPQPAIVWASSSSVYGLNSRVPFSEADRTDRITFSSLESIPYLQQKLQERNEFEESKLK